MLILAGLKHWIPLIEKNIIRYEKQNYKTLGLGSKKKERKRSAVSRFSLIHSLDIGPTTTRYSILTDFIDILNSVLHSQIFNIYLFFLFKK